MTLYIDMDGVLCDFIKSADEIVGVWNPQDRRKERKVFEAGTKFWADMPWMPDGRELWEYVKIFDPHILSAKSDWCPNAAEGKYKWLKQHIPDIPVSRIHIVDGADEKQQYSGCIHVLVDDYHKNTTQWYDAGGLAILHKNTVSTIFQLETLGYINKENKFLGRIPHNVTLGHKKNS